MSNKLTTMDSNMIQRHQHDEDNQAQRVVLVGGDFGIKEAVQESLKDLKLDIKLPEQKTQVQQQPFIIEKEVIVKEYELLKVQEIVKEYEIKVIEIEKPIVVTETKLIEVPVIHKEIQFVDKEVIVKEVKDLDKFVKYMLIIQTIGVIATLIKLFL